MLIVLQQAQWQRSVGFCQPQNWYNYFETWRVTLIVLTWRIWWVPNNASRWQMGCNSAFNCIFSFAITKSTDSCCLGKSSMLIFILLSHNLCVCQMCQQLYIALVAKWIIVVLFPLLVYLADIRSQVHSVNHRILAMPLTCFAFTDILWKTDNWINVCTSAPFQRRGIHLQVTNVCGT